MNWRLGAFATYIVSLHWLTVSSNVGYPREVLQTEQCTRARTPTNLEICLIDRSVIPCSMEETVPYHLSLESFLSSPLLILTLTGELQDSLSTRGANLTRPTGWQYDIISGPPPSPCEPIWAIGWPPPEVHLKIYEQPLTDYLASGIQLFSVCYFIPFFNISNALLV